ncbi:MAG: TetR/AcrR family transcriptional regulator [bacterium]|nr:TetR/AcrR family transcriptional regulator [bacterium]
MPEAPDPRRATILEAAYKAFALYGYRRTSMEEIARGTGLSRASLYLQFANKEEIFRALCERVHGEAVDEAEAALASDAPLASRLEDALVAKVGRLLDVVADSPHGDEIVDESSRLCGDIVLASSERFQKVLASALAAAVRAGELRLAGSGLSAPAAAEMLRLSATGLKYGAGNARDYRKRTRRLVRVFLAGFDALG